MWQPIETAPKDETLVDIWRSAFGGERCTDMRRIDLGKGNVFYEGIEYSPACVRDATHWMPIPEAPNAESPSHPNKVAIEAVEQCRQIIYDATHPGNDQSESIWITAKARIYHLLKKLHGEH